MEIYCRELKGRTRGIRKTDQLHAEDGQEKTGDAKHYRYEEYHEIFELLRKYVDEGVATS